jgi:hypothetical protein
MTADPNPYRPPTSDSENVDSVAVPRDKLASRAFVVGVVQAVVWIALGLWVLRIASGFKKIFLDFGTELPGTTVAFIQFTHFLGHYWYLALLAVALWPLANRRIVFLLSPRPDVVIPRRLWYCATWAVPILVVLFGLFALLHSLSDLFTRLSR